ncbi:MAG: S4 domain-containing protein, partial [Gemmatimonadota bacterium]|nr:S4 domain-containing protein [Gemmatimonadota bacterium]
DLLFRQKEVPGDISLIVVRMDEPELAANEGAVALTRLLVRVGLAPSTSQATRLIEEGAVSLDGVRVGSRGATVPAPGEYLLQKGKRHFLRVRLV